MADQAPTSPRIFTYLEARIPVRCNEHIAIVQRGGAAVWGAEFLSEGLLRGHWCGCVASATSRLEMLTRLGELGVEVERHVENKTLQFPMAAQGAGKLMEWAKGFFADAETVGAPAVRWLEEGVWVKPEDITGPHFFELHSRLNYLVKQYPSVALCRYDTEHLEIPQLFSAIAVHRHLVVEGTLVRDNPFYIPAEKFLAMSREDRERDLRNVFREVGFDLVKLLSTLAGYGQLQRPTPPSW